jgi:hypothetical protein
MSPDAAALEVLQADRWKQDPLAAVAAHFIETGDADALARLQQPGKRPRWWREVLDAMAGVHFWEREEINERPFQALAPVLPAKDLAAWAKRRDVPQRERSLICWKLMRWNEPAFRDVALQVAREQVDSPPHGTGCQHWVLENFGRELLPNLAAGLERGAKEGQFGCALRRGHLADIVAALGKDALPAVLSAFRDPWVNHAATGHLIDLDPEGHADLIRQAIEQGLMRKEPDEVIEYLELAARWRLGDVAEKIWPLLEHRSKRVREAAARTLAGLGKAALPGAAEALRHRKADVRLAAVGLLAVINSGPARELLRPLANRDSSGAVRDAVRKILKSASAGGAPGLGREEILTRARKVVAKLKEGPAAWIKEKARGLRYGDGEPVEIEAVRYLIHRQARAKKVEPDLEAQALCNLIDRRTSGDLALALLNKYLSAGAKLDDRWELVLACLLGDGRVVPPLHAQIRAWAEGQQPKRAEDGVRALALLDSDAALMTLDSLAVRYRSKRPYLGEAATEGFNQAAEKRGLTPDELGDRVVPWVGFEPGKPRVLAWGKRQVEARVGLDFRLSLLDRETGKPLRALPAGAPQALQAEVKEQAALLREAVKAQRTRLENLLVRQHRWPAGRWRELFLEHPLLLPFAVRLVWGAHDEAGKLTATFRALEDRSLTAADDTAVSLPGAGSVGIVHPLELNGDVRQAWERHLADYEIEPPFEQLARPVIPVPPGQEREKFAKDYDGVSVSAGTFRSRAEKLGWARGEVGSGAIQAYWKWFPAAGLDAVVGLEDLYVGAGWDEEITLGPVCFVRHPGEGRRAHEGLPRGSDRGLVPLGKVPPVVYSETLGDLQKVAGRKADAAAEKAEP